MSPMQAPTPTVMEFSSDFHRLVLHGRAPNGAGFSSSLQPSLEASEPMQRWVVSLRLFLPPLTSIVTPDAVFGVLVVDSATGYVLSVALLSCVDALGMINGCGGGGDGGSGHCDVSGESRVPSIGTAPISPVSPSLLPQDLSPPLATEVLTHVGIACALESMRSLLMCTCATGSPASASKHSALFKLLATWPTRGAEFGECANSVALWKVIASSVGHVWGGLSRSVDRPCGSDSRWGCGGGDISSNDFLQEGTHFQGEIGSSAVENGAGVKNFFSFENNNNKISSRTIPAYLIHSLDAAHVNEQQQRQKSLVAGFVASSTYASPSLPSFVSRSLHSLRDSVNVKASVPGMASRLGAGSPRVAILSWMQQQGRTHEMGF